MGARDEEYVFDGPRGTETLEQLFDGRSQLVVYHAMFDPKTVTPKTPYTKDAPCSMCSFWMDNLERVVVHLAHRDVTLIAASRAPVKKLEAYKKRMDWTFKWVSVGDGDFNRDYSLTLTAEEIANGQGDYNYARTGMPIAELPGISVFIERAEILTRGQSLEAPLAELRVPAASSPPVDERGSAERENVARIVRETIEGLSKATPKRDRPLCSTKQKAGLAAQMIFVLFFANPFGEIPL